MYIMKIKQYKQDFSRLFHHLFIMILGSCAFTKCTKSAKEGKLFLQVSTPSVDFPYDFAGVDVVAKCNTMTQICLMEAPELLSPKCELVSEPSPPYVIIVSNGARYHTCDVLVTLTPSTHCEHSKKLTLKAEAEGFYLYMSNNRNTNDPHNYRVYQKK